MIELVLLGSILVFSGSAKGQGDDYRGYQKPLPLILMHKQALSHDGQFNYAFAADNGLKQGESINPDGSRSGAYSYVDPSGQTISVKYTAGKDGFKILEGDHVPKPVAPLPVQSVSPYQHYSGQSARHYPRHYDAAETDKGIGSALAYIHAQDRPSSHYRSPSPSSYRVQEDSGQQYDSRDDDYNPQLDEHKGPHSFGSGYSFEFGG